MKTSKSIQFSRFNTPPTAPLSPPPPPIKKLAVAPSDVQSNLSAHFEQIVEKTPAPSLEYLSGTDFFIIFEMVLLFSCLQCLTISGWIHFHNFEVCIILFYLPGSPSRWTTFLPRVPPDLLSWESPHFGIASLEVGIAMNFLCDRSSNQKVPRDFHVDFQNARVTISEKKIEGFWAGYIISFGINIDLVQIKEQLNQYIFHRYRRFNYGLWQMIIFRWQSFLMGLPLDALSTLYSLIKAISSMEPINSSTNDIILLFGLKWSW